MKIESPLGVSLEVLNALLLTPIELKVRYKRVITHEELKTFFPIKFADPTGNGENELARLFNPLTHEYIVVEIPSYESITRTLLKNVGIIAYAEEKENGKFIAHCIDGNKTEWISGENVYDYYTKEEALDDAICTALRFYLMPQYVTTQLQGKHVIMEFDSTDGEFHKGDKGTIAKVNIASTRGFDSDVIIRVRIGRKLVKGWGTLRDISFTD